MVDRLKAAWNVNVKHTEFEGADHRAGGKGVFRKVELLDWILGFERSVGRLPGTQSNCGCNRILSLANAPCVLAMSKSM